MLLAIDIGNSNIVIGGIDDKDIHFMERIDTDADKSDIEYAVLIDYVLSVNHISHKDIDAAIISSVVPSINHIISSAIDKAVGIMPSMVSCNMNTGIIFDMKRPETLGSDLIVDSVAAIYNYGAPVIVVDMGTATTITIVDKNYHFIGGIIHPGLSISLETLIGKAANLSQISLANADNIITTDTSKSIRNGALYGHASIIDGCTLRMIEELGYDAKIVLTGGLSKYVAPLCKSDIYLDDNLMIKGLYRLYELNK